METKKYKCLNCGGEYSTNKKPKCSCSKPSFQEIKLKEEVKEIKSPSTPAQDQETKSKEVSKVSTDKTKEAQQLSNDINKSSKLRKNYIALTRRGQIENFWEKQPFYYDDSKIFWLWDKENYKWIIGDEVDFCNSIYDILGVDTIDAKARGELIAGFKQVGRLHKPQDMKKSWVQYKNKVYDIKTDEVFEASPKYFITNPIPHKVGESEDTPTIDKLFDDWMKGQEDSWKETLYQIIAYNTCIDKFMQRIIALIGGGSNGKGTYIKLNYRFLGKDNYVSSEIKALSEDKFEPFVLYKKLLCVMGEVSYNDLKNTNQIKKLAGEDKMSFQKKGHTPFTADNTTTCICLTNSMPITPDKTQGFYRKIMIIDFLNQFKQIDKNIIDEIPDVEFENLAKKCLRISKELYKNPHFTNEGDFKEREKRYEERSNPVMKFVDIHCKEVAGEIISIRDFTNAFNNYQKNNHQRVMNSHQIGKILRSEGFIVGARKIEGISAVGILNLLLKDNKTTKTIINPISNLRKESNTEMDSNKGLNNFLSESTPKTENLDESDKKVITPELKDIMEDFS